MFPLDQIGKTTLLALCTSDITMITKVPLRPFSDRGFFWFCDLRTYFMYWYILSLLSLRVGLERSSFLKKTQKCQNVRSTLSRLKVNNLTSHPNLFVSKLKYLKPQFFFKGTDTLSVSNNFMLKMQLEKARLKVWQWKFHSVSSRSIKVACQVEVF